MLTNTATKQGSSRKDPRPAELAKVLGDPSLISQSAVAGTFAYIAPEQIEARRDIDGRADIYALGVMTYQLLTGELPFKHEHQGALLIAHMLHPPPDAREKAPDLPEHAFLKNHYNVILRKRSSATEGSRAA